MSQVLKYSPKESAAFPFNKSEAMRDLKVSIATLDHHVEMCTDWDVAREFENRLKKLLNSVTTKRMLLRPEKS